ELKPHIFTVAEESYRNVQSQIPLVNQSIIVSGESGAGKTWTSRCLMKFYATVAASPDLPEGSISVERIEQRVLDSNPVMEAFGNACTLRNNNSSRFGKYIQLHLNRSQLLTSASIQTFLLEKTRVAYQAPQERNFHIFYQIAKGATLDERQEWDLLESAQFCWLPNSEKTLEEDSFDVTREAMTHLGIDSFTQNNVFKILAGLLHLGNVQFCESEDEAQLCELEDLAKGFAETASRLLRVPEERLLDTLISFGSFLERYGLLKKLKEQNLKATSSQENGFWPVAGNGKSGTPPVKEEGDILQSEVQDILQQVKPSNSSVKPGETRSHNLSMFCGKTKIFLTSSMLELLEFQRASILSEKAYCIQCCWRRFRRKKVARQRWSATIIQSAVRQWLTRKHFQKLRKAVRIIKQAWKKWKTKMAVIAAEELDGMEEHPSLLRKAASSRQAAKKLDGSWPLNSIIHSWPLSLVLSRAPTTLGGLQRDLALLTCLQVLEKVSWTKAETRLPVVGVSSIRAPPQGSIKFHCRKSPLLYANTRPYSHSCIVAGFNQILLDQCAIP
ncbi:unconventional myosin-XIX-like, partial [Protobothrops mucrosquamatus]|uniref:unconventional myosin-XIX-like n=1 Tax=Protobothrops mucrosquamatus TaxID=103944 RepID=UPI0007758848